MTSKKLFNDLQRRHEHASMKLPDFMAGKLNTAERLAVEQHLKTCDLCLTEWSESQVLKGAFRVRKEHSLWQPPPDHFNQLLERLVIAEAPTQKASAVIQDSLTQAAKINASAASNPGKSKIGRYHSGIIALIANLSELPLYLRCLLVLESIVLATVCLIFVPSDPENLTYGGALYETLTTTSNVGVEAHNLRISLTFAETMTELEIRNLLKSTNAQLVSGPSDLGVYSIMLPASQASKVQIDKVLAAYRNNPKVRVLTPEQVPESINSIVNPDEHP
ncbi:MAG: zf-HC2 domain-containing protein [Methylococcales bacterium]|nr:zf-HC2 domain-containing protein [Methylococcaceae bacterium]